MNTADTTLYQKTQPTPIQQKSAYSTSTNASSSKDASCEAVDTTLLLVNLPLEKKTSCKSQVLSDSQEVLFAETMSPSSKVFAI